MELKIKNYLLKMELGKLKIRILLIKSLLSP